MKAEEEKRKHSLMPNVLISKRCIVIWSIVCVNNASAASSNYALLLSNLWFILVSLHELHIDFLFYCTCWSCEVNGDVLHVHHKSYNKTNVRLSSVFAYVQLCVYVWVCTVYMFVFIPSSEMQLPSKSQFRELLCFIAPISSQMPVWLYVRRMCVYVYTHAVDVIYSCLVCVCVKCCSWSQDRKKICLV